MLHHPLEVRLALKDVFYDELLYENECKFAIQCPVFARFKCKYREISNFKTKIERHILARPLGIRRMTKMFSLFREQKHDTKFGFG